jgi:cold shock CspA family protein
LAKLSQKSIEDVLRILSTSPLAIKWFVLAAEAGQAPETILRQQTDLIRFCVQNVYQGLPELAKDAAVVLAHVNRPLSIQDLKLYFQAATPDQLRIAMQELLRRSLCNISIADDVLAERFQATDALVEYLRIIGGASDDFLERMQRTEHEYRREEERLRLEQGRNPLRVNVISGSLEHRASALRLRDALKYSANGDNLKALQIIDEVEQLEPEYWELFRVRGFILSQAGHIDEATASYEQAISLAPDPEANARVRYFYAGHLTRKARDSASALVQARAAHKVLQRHETALELGKVLTYLNEFSSAIELLRYACGSSDVRTRLIAGTQLVDALRRKAEFEAGDLRSPASAIDTLQTALQEGSLMLSNGVRDQRLEEQLYKCIADALKVASLLSERDKRDKFLRTIVPIAQTLPPASVSGERRYLARYAARLLTKADLPDEIVRVLRELANLGLEDDNSDNLSPVPIGRELVGRISTWKPDRGFGFIAAIDGSGSYFFHALDLERLAEQLFIERGLVVQFTVDVSKGRPRATCVSLRDAPDTSIAKTRTLTVLAVKQGFVLARDDRSGASVIVRRYALRDSGSWNSIMEGTALVADIQVEHRDGFAAVAGSVVILS